MNAMIKLIKNADVYTPYPIGIKDILIVGDKICKIADHINGYDEIGEEIDVFDACGQRVIPGYIDLHVHITGGGGEQGPASRVPESTLTSFTKSGITTVVGLLGTDGITRSLENLVAKARALTEEGITVYTLTSSYAYPPVTITGSVEKDITMIPEMIGVKVAVSDHRSSNPQAEELIRLATEARRGGMFSGSAGLVMMHMGSGKAGLQPLFDALDRSDIPIKHFLPTHMARSEELLEQGRELIARGGYMDITVGSDPKSLKDTANIICDLIYNKKEGKDHITLTTDAFGSQPRFDENGNCIGLTYASPEYLHKTVRELLNRGVPLCDILKTVTTTPAKLIGKTGVKGCIAEGANADLILLSENCEIETVWAKGNTAIRNREIIMRGKFE